MSATAAPSPESDKPAPKRSVDGHLRVLRAYSAERHPFTEDSGVPPEIGPAYVALAHATADFVDAARLHWSYQEGLAVLHATVRTFPLPPSQDEAVAQFGRAFLAALAAAPTAVEPERSGQ